VRVLVTGGAGYIGSATVRRLRQGGHDPVVLDTLDRGHREAVETARLVVGDVRDRRLVEQLLVDEGIDGVLHFAARKSVGESMTDPLAYFATNVGGSLALLDAMATAGVDRLVFSSTCAVYGTPAVLPVRESTAQAPENPYGESKRIVEQVLGWTSTTTRLRAFALRYFNAAGASADGLHGEDWANAENLVPVVMQVAMGRVAAVRVFGTDYPTPDGTAVRDYVHVDDLAEAHVLALEALGAGDPGGVLNLGTGAGESVREVVDMARTVTGRQIATIDAPRRAGDPAAIWADTTLARERLGWQATRGLREIVETAWAWHVRNPDGYAGTRESA
jgi:UDP-glucose-4-epimerase GalE